MYTFIHFTETERMYYVGRLNVTAENVEYVYRWRK